MLLCFPARPPGGGGGVGALLDKLWPLSLLLLHHDAGCLILHLVNVEDGNSTRTLLPQESLPMKACQMISPMSTFLLMHHQIMIGSSQQLGHERQS